MDLHYALRKGMEPLVSPTYPMIRRRLISSGRGRRLHSFLSERKGKGLFAVSPKLTSERVNGAQ